MIRYLANNVSILWRITSLVVTLFILVKCADIPVEKYPWKNYRGVNAGVNLTEQDIKDLAATGANLIRLSMPSKPLMDLEPPHAFNEEAFSYMDSVIIWAEKYDLHVLIDPHRFPGTVHPWTMLGSDPFWEEFKWHDHAIHLWEEIAERYQCKGDVIAGYDLLNEPEMKPDIQKGSPGDLNYLYKRMIKAIRKYDRSHTIVIALPRSFENEIHFPYCDGIRLLDIPDDDNICIETHTYFPMGFSHQGVFEKKDPFTKYPGTINDEYWDMETLIRKQKLLIDFSNNHDIPLFLGEFSCPRWTGKSGNTYLKDIIDIAEMNDWSWAYHSYREADIWDPEMSNSDKNDKIRYNETPRMKLLQSYFTRNHKE